MSSLLTLSEANESVLAGLPEPKDLWKWFLLLSQQPRVPEHCEKVKEWLMEVGKAIGCDEVLSDNAGNVVLRKNAKPGFEDLPSVCFQAHMDMVCSANDGTVHDFSKDQLQLFIDGDWLKAKNTTLGADDGIGVAACLALLSDPNAQHGPIEALFTADEETTMGGAENIDRNILKSEYLINVDTEDGNAICIGCAGGFEVDIDLDVTREAQHNPDHDVVELFFYGFRGGHSGIDINRGRGNAIISVARILVKALAAFPSLRLCTYFGGTAINTIPRESKAVISIPKSETSKFLELVKEEVHFIRQELVPIEETSNVGVTTTVLSDISGIPAPVNSVNTQKVLDLVLVLPYGPLRMVPHDLEQVETSINLGKVELQETKFNVHPFARSSSVTQTEFVYQQLVSYGRISGAHVSEKTNAFPGWDPARQMSGKLLKPAIDILTKAYGEAPKVYSVHAGLECGLFIGAYPNMECISIGPIIEEAHTPQERCNIPSVATCYTTILELAKAIPK